MLEKWWREVKDQRLLQLAKKGSIHLCFDHPGCILDDSRLVVNTTP